MSGGEYRIGRFSTQAKVESMPRRQETDSLWESLESLFAITMWRPEGVPLINTVLSGNRIQIESNLPTRTIRNWVANSAGDRRDWRTTKIRGQLIFFVTSRNFFRRASFAELLKFNQYLCKTQLNTN